MSKLSVITICYNEPNLEDTCKSIVSQTWQDFEWIVIDGGSNKVTLDIFEKYKHRIDKFVSEPDKGIYDACNKGIKLAQSEFINFLNAGDMYSDSNVLHNVFNNYNLDADIVYGDMYFLKKDRLSEKLSTKPDCISGEFLINFTIYHPSSFIKRELFDKYGLYDENYKIVSDWEKWIVFYKNGAKFVHIPLAVAKFDTNGISSSPEYKKLHFKERNAVLNKYFSKQEIHNAFANDSKLKDAHFTILQKIFSLRNLKKGKYKIITIFGKHIIKRNIK